MVDSQRERARLLLLEYDAKGFKRDLAFDYDKSTEFEVIMHYKQSGDNEAYSFYNKYTLDDLDFIRRRLISGVYRLDCEVFYKQLMSEIYHKLGKLRQGLEIVLVNGQVLYEVDEDSWFNTLNSGSTQENFRYEKILDSPKNNEYLDETLLPGRYFLS